MAQLLKRLSGRARTTAAVLRRRWKLVAAVLCAIAFLSFAGYIFFRGIVRFKAMVDHGSVGTDYIKIAMTSGRPDDPVPLVRSAEEFARLKSDLEHWGWVIALSNVLPPVSSQFRALEAIQDSGEDLVAARAYPTLPTGVFGRTRGTRRACAPPRRGCRTRTGRCSTSSSKRSGTTC